MEHKQVTLENLYEIMQNIQQELHEIKGKIEDKELIWDWDDVEIFADEKVLSEDWLSPEEDEAWKDL